MTSSYNKQFPYRFGAKIRTIRERKGLTLRQVAQAAQVSESLVSQIERNKVSPAIDTLLAIASALDINLEYLFEEFRRTGKVQVIRAGERRIVTEGAVVYQELARPAENDGTHALESFMVIVPPGEHTHSGSYGHIGREFGIIVEGEARFEYEGEAYTLSEGDSVSFAASIPHTISNPGTATLRAFWVVSPPHRFG
ncbi:MAG: XRE family transcriptional regulator [Spirochaetaceae bacterium]|jgi:transcriptional regulator with XRE-family HTH domain|nr:XRE family transcriptional regulator [Spirochaetaceae bacterium]